MASNPTPLRPLASLRSGEEGVVWGIVGGTPELRNKLLTHGMVAGSRVVVERAAPLGDPIAVKLLGFTLSLRLAEASGILIAPA